MEGGRDALVGTGPERYRCRVASRPQMTLAVKRLIRDMVARLPELAHVKPSRILVVAGEARRASRATIRPAHFRETRARGGRGGLRKPLIRIGGRKILYVITLRPLWFRASTPEQRVGTVLHELWHASERFDGTLHRGRVHGRLPRPRFERRIRALRDRYLAVAATTSSRRSPTVESPWPACGWSARPGSTGWGSTAAGGPTPRSSSSWGSCA